MRVLMTFTFERKECSGNGHCFLEMPSLTEKNILDQIEVMKGISGYKTVIIKGVFKMDEETSPLVLDVPV